MSAWSIGLHIVCAPLYKSKCSRENLQRNDWSTNAIFSTSAWCVCIFSRKFLWSYSARWTRVERLSPLSHFFFYSDSPFWLIIYWQTLKTAKRVGGRRSDGQPRNDEYYKDALSMMKDSSDSNAKSFKIGLYREYANKRRRNANQNAIDG